MTDAQFLLDFLGDGEPKSQAAILRASFDLRGHGLTVHSRIADLRRQGHIITCDRVPGKTRGQAWTYTLLVSPPVWSCHHCGSHSYRHVTDDIFRCDNCNQIVDFVSLRESPCPEDDPGRPSSTVPGRTGPLTGDSQSESDWIYSLGSLSDEDSRQPAHGAQGEPATTSSKVNETRGERSSSESELTPLFTYQRSPDWA